MCFYIKNFPFVAYFKTFKDFTVLNFLQIGCYVFACRKTGGQELRSQKEKVKESGVKKLSHYLCSYDWQSIRLNFCILNS